MKKIIQYLSFVCAGGIILASCQKFDRPQLGEYPTDDPVTPATALRFFVPFDSTKPEAKQLNIRFADEISGRPSFFIDKAITFDQGITGTAYKGANGVAIRYLNPNDMKLATSFSIAFWMKQTEAAASDRTEFYFSFADDTYGWGHSAIFMMVEHGTATEATVKVGLMDQWLEFPDGNKLKKPMLDGNWHHWAIVYDEATSKMTYYFDGVVVAAAPASATDVKKDGNPRGKLDLTKATSLVIGGWNAQAGLTGPTDDWVKSYTGLLDQFRMYNKVLSASEVKELYDGKK